MSARFPRPPVLAAIPATGHAVIEASAGTGKTYTLEHFIVDALLSGQVTIDQILVVTFTERATTELRQRVRALLGKLIDHREETPSDDDWVLDAAARARLDAAQRGLDGAAISTIHGFCQRVLGELAFENGRLFAEERVDAGQAFTRAWIELVRRELARDPAMAEVLELSLEGGASLDGLAQLLRKAISERGTRVQRFEPATFPAALAAVTLDLGAIEAELVRAQVHARTRSTLLGHLETLAGTLEAARASASPWRSLAQVRAWIDERQDYVLEKLPAGWTREVISGLCEKAPNLAAAAVGVLAEPMEAALRRHKRQQGQFDFDDLLLLVRDALRGERGGAITARLQARFPLALVDEFQDTDEVQWEIFRTLFATAAGRLVLVGDPKQSIYLFRGADVQTYLTARETLLGAAPALKLTACFRSTAPLLGALNTLLAQDEAPLFTGEVRYDAPVTCGNPGRTDAQPGDDGAPIRLWHVVGKGKFSSSHARNVLLARMVREVRALLEPKTAMRLRDGDEERALTAKDIYVLTRSESEGRAVGAALREAGIPVAFFKQDGLFQTPEAHHVRDVLDAIDRPGDRAARARAWLTPIFGLGLDEIARARDLPGTHPLMTRLLDWHALAQAGELGELFERVVADSGLVRRELFQGGSERALTNYQQLFEHLLERTARAPATLAELVRALDAYRNGSALPPGEDANVQRLETENDAVQIMTLHKSKGLEAAVVFLFGGFNRANGGDAVRVFHAGRERRVWVGSDAPPEIAPLLEREALEENQRLLYVGVTRAKHRLYLPFFDELDEADLAGRDPDDSGTPSRPLSGTYAALNERLRHLRRAGQLTRENGFSRERVSTRGRGGAVPAHALSSAPLVAAPLEPDERPRRLRHSHAGFGVTSYSRMAAAAHAQEDEDAQSSQRDPAAAWVRPGPEEVPSGAAAGVFLHAVLEHAPLELTRAARDFESWQRAPAISSLVERTARFHGFESFAAHAARLTWNALRTSIALPEGQALPGIAAADRALRELEFLFPIPERSHPLLGGPPGRFSIERGCIKGFIDLVVEHGGRAYFADWKSDLRESYEPGALAAHVAEHYGIQQRLYTLALVRLLGIRDREAYERRFGGSLYLFLRGMDASRSPSPGVHVARARWDEVVAWERELVDHREWGVRVA